MALKPYQTDFIHLAIAASALQFGEFKLKSGRISPYFFNAGAFRSGKALAELGRCYIEALYDFGVEFDMLFGPAYKGIPLATATAIACANQFGRDLPVAYNRKEAKDHGEGGTLVGAPLEGNVAIIDDVITAGTAIREVLTLIPENSAKASVIAIGLDRQERGTGSLSATQELRQHYGIPVTSIIKLQDLILYVSQAGDHRQVAALEAYREQYGVNDDNND